MLLNHPHFIILRSIQSKLWSAYQFQRYDCSSTSSKFRVTKNVVNIIIECKCGKLRGTADSRYAKGYRAICLCDDCQAYAHYLDQATNVLDINGGTDIFPINPAELKITQGIENLKCIRLIPKGMFRWYAGCCKTPIANSSASIPYIGMVHTILEKTNNAKELENQFGPPTARIQGKFGIKPLPAGTLEKVSLAFILRALKLMLLVHLRGLTKPSPFLDKDGKPLVEPYILSTDERQRLRP